MERLRQREEQKGIIRYHAATGRWYEGVVSDGGFQANEVDIERAREIDNDYVNQQLDAYNAEPDYEAESTQSASSSDSGFEMTIRVRGGRDDLPYYMRHFGSDVNASSPAYEYPALSAGTGYEASAPVRYQEDVDTAPTPVVRNTPQAPIGYEQYPSEIDTAADYRDDSSEGETPEINATDVRSMPRVRQNLFDEEDDALAPRPSGRPERRVPPKPRSNKKVVFGVIGLIAAGVMVDGFHAVSEVKEDTIHSVCPLGACLAPNFVRDMLPPFGPSEPAKTTKEEKK